MEQVHMSSGWVDFKQRGRTMFQWIGRCGGMVADAVLGVYQRGCYHIQSDMELLYGLDHQSFKSASSNKLSDLRDGASPSHQPFHHSSGASVDRRKQLSQSTEALSPSASRRARPQLKTDYDTLKYASPTLDASAAKRSTQQLELELRRTQERLEMERKQKEELAGQVHKLLHDNKRLQGESASTAEQLQQFTDWFFNAIEK